MKLKHPVVHGHPLHAMVSDLPAALLPTALVAAAIARADPSARNRYLSDASLGGGVAAAALAGAVGWWDWLTIPDEHPAKSPATTHGLLNTAGIGAGVLALALPRRRLELLLGLNATLMIAAWLGGDLVYRLGWRVRPAEELEQLDEGKSRDEARAVIEQHEREDTFVP